MVENAIKFVEKFEKDFQKNLTPENLFFLNTKGTSSAALTVNIPQYLTEIEDGGTGLQLDVEAWDEANSTVTQRRFRTKAYVIEDANAFFAAQDLRKDCMDSITDFLDTAVGNYAAYQMATVSATLGSTGTTSRVTSVVGSTAVVNTICEADMLKVRELIAASNIGGNWYCLADAKQISDMLSIANFTTAEKLGVQSRLINGEFADILGIKFYQRSPKLGANVVYDVNGLKKNSYSVPGGITPVAPTTTDTAGMLFWSDKALYSNLGFSKMYLETGRADYQGDLLSSQHFFGIEPIRADKVGIITLVETTKVVTP